MITAKELRLGNLVNFMEDDTIFTVDEIVTDGIGVHNEEQSTWIDIDQFSGIPLAEEWLLKFGFSSANIRYKPRNTHWLCKNFSLWCNSDQQYSYLWNDGSIHIKYVHQLQNLFHSLTGKELEVVNEN